MSETPAGWYPDGSGEVRYWDGSRWTEATRAVARTPDPAPAPAPDPAATIATDRGPLPLPVVLLGVGGLVLILGSFLPWFAVFLYGLSGITAHYGLVALLAGVFAFGTAVQLATGRLFAPRAARPLLVVTAVLSIAAIVTAVLVGFVVREDALELVVENPFEAAETEYPISEDDANGDGQVDDLDLDGEPDPEASVSAEIDDDEFDDPFGTNAGSGIYLTMVGGLVTTTGCALAVRRRRTEQQ